MTNRETVIGRLNEAAEYFRECRSHASLGSNAENHFGELQSAMQEAAELLKAQEPRVMTLEEVCAAVQKNATLFTECEKENQWVTEGMAHFSDLALFNDPKYDDCKITFIRHTYDGTQKNEWYVYLKNYNKTWRCWTARPTDEQREATPWE